MTAREERQETAAGLLEKARRHKSLAGYHRTKAKEYFRASAQFKERCEALGVAVKGAGINHGRTGTK